MAVRATRCYRGDTLVLETQFDTPGGRVRIIDFMVRRDGATDVVRLVQGVRGTVPMRLELVVRFDYGSVAPWVSHPKHQPLELIAGPDRLTLAIDARGWMWTTAEDGIHVIAPDRTPLGYIPTPSVSSNRIFGGPDMRRLFITATTYLLAIDLNIPIEGRTVRNSIGRSPDPNKSRMLAS